MCRRSKTTNQKLFHADADLEDLSESEISTPTNSDVADALKTLHIYLDHKGLKEITEAFYPIEEEITRSLANEKQQTKLTDFLIKHA